MNPSEAPATREAREHVVVLSAADVAYLRKWLENPAGGLGIGNAMFESAEGGGILIRTRAFRVGAS